MKSIIKRIICALNYHLGNFDDVLFLIGDGRSGTTWIEEVINFDKRYREMFEPFQGRKGYCLNGKRHYPYLMDLQEPAYIRHMKRVFRGAFINTTVSYSNPRLIYSGLFIKDISAHFILDAIYRRNQNAKYLMVIRHPFAVAFSKLKASSWHSDLPSLLESRHTCLEPYREILEAEHEPLLKHVIVWCVLHKVAFQSKAIQAFEFVFYEQLTVEPEFEFERLFRVLDKAAVFNSNKEAILQGTKHQSRLTSVADNSIVSSQKGSSRWMEEWSQEQICEAFKILEIFQMDFVYGKGHFPKLSASELKAKLLSKNFYV